MPALPQSTIIGSWRVVRAEPEQNDRSEQRFLHFSSDGVHLWEHPFATGVIPRLSSFHYRMTDRGVFITPFNQTDGWEVPFTWDGTCLLFEKDNKRWWLQRIAADERPKYLEHFYPPPSD